MDIQSPHGTELVVRQEDKTHTPTITDRFEPLKPFQYHMDEFDGVESEEEMQKVGKKVQKKVLFANSPERISRGGNVSRNGCDGIPRKLF